MGNDSCPFSEQRFWILYCQFSVAITMSYFINSILTTHVKLLEKIPKLGLHLGHTVSYHLMSPAFISTNYFQPFNVLCSGRYWQASQQKKRFFLDIALNCWQSSLLLPWFKCIEPLCKLYLISKERLFPRIEHGYYYSQFGCFLGFAVISLIILFFLLQSKSNFQ